MALFNSSFSFGGESTSNKVNLTGTNVWKDYVLGKELGRGTYGSVYLATKRKDGNKVAIKEIPKRRCRDLNKLRNEVKIMEQLHHPNVLNLLGHYENTNYMHLALELCEGGEVFELLAEGMTESDAANVMYQSLLAIRHCHDHNVIHRDLKPQNLLLKSPVDNFDDAQLKVVDFGASMIYTEALDRRGGVHEVMGTISYMAPEVLMARTKGYSYQCDLWSLGVILFQMITGEKPFANQLDIKNCTYNFNAPEWSRVSPQCKHMVSRLMEYDTFKRLNVHEALAHPWIAKHVDTNLYSLGSGGQTSSPKRKSRRQSSKKRGALLHTEKATKALKQFVTRGKVSRKLSMAIAKACRDNGRDSVMSLKQAFKAIDTNGDGTITFEEMSKHVKESGGIKEDVMMIMSSFDTNTDFRISYEEFIGNGLNQVEYDQEAEEHHQQFASKYNEDNDNNNNKNDGDSRGVHDDDDLIMEMKNLIDAYYKAESDRKLGRLRGKLMKQAKTLHARAANNTNPKVKYKLEDLIRLGLLNTGW